MTLIRRFPNDFSIFDISDERRKPQIRETYARETRRVRFPTIAGRVLGLFLRGTFRDDK